MMKKEEFIKKELELYSAADKTVIEFIADMKFRCGDENVEVIEKLFTSGYCWYFAHMLQQAFGRGKVCYAYFEGHFVWLDGTSEKEDFAYDIYGVNKNWEHLIPEELIGDGILDFKHVRGNQSNMEEQDIIKLLLNIIDKKQFAYS
ncbi:hypothetical protein [Frisingicoccus sp.]|uniref:hypothetical protein n=1 Tax=Frisingicoccus sp. TaxID=1918627 RepID=UPI00399A3BB8